MSNRDLTPFVVRPGVGTTGKPVNILVNFFEITRLPDANVHHYDVTITPDVPPKLNRLVYRTMVERYTQSHLGGSLPVYDGRKNMFSLPELPFKSHTFEVSLAQMGYIHITMRNWGLASETETKKTRCLITCVL